MHANRDLDFTPYVSAVLPALLQQCAESECTGDADNGSQSADERSLNRIEALFSICNLSCLLSVRNIVSECLGLMLSMQNLADRVIIMVVY